MDAKSPAKPKKRNVFLIIVCILAILALLLGAVLLTVTLVRRSSYVVLYDARGVDGKMLNYLARYAKYSLFASLTRAGISPSDDGEFLSSDASAYTGVPGKSYRELLCERTKEYLSSLLVASSLFDRAGKLTGEDEKNIDRLLSDLLANKAGGSESEYNAAVRAMGFDLSAVRRAVTMQYKASAAQARLYGADGSGIAAETEFLADFLTEYAHIEMFYVPAQEEETIAKVRSAMAGEDGVLISPMLFENYRKSADQSGVSAPDGFYFRAGTAYTNAYEKEHPAVVQTALSLAVGEYGEAEATLEGGVPAVCFLYRSPLTPAAYARRENEEYFGDFYALAAAKRFSSLIAALAEDVTFRSSYDPAALASLPLDVFYDYYVRF